MTSKASEDQASSFPSEQQERLPGNILTLHLGGENKWAPLPPESPFQSTAWLVPAIPRVVSVGAGQPIADIHSAHTLASDSSVKYQCICCLGDVPQKHHAPYILIIRSLSFFFFCFCFFSFFFFLWMSTLMKKKRRRNDKKE